MSRDKLLADREELVKQIEELKAKPLRTKSVVEANGRQEDLTNLARKVVAIDRKLGRS